MSILITQEEFLKIVSFFSDYENESKNQNRNIEIESRIETSDKTGRIITPNQFTRLLHYIRKIYGDLQEKDIELDIISHRNRMTIIGKSNIQNFIENMEKNIDIEFTHKNIKDKIILQNYDVSFKLSWEEKVSNIKPQDIFSSPFQILRLKNRYSLKISEYLRFDFTFIKQNTTKNHKDIENAILNAKPQYEVEIEVVNIYPQKTNTNLFKTLTVQMISYMMEFLKVIDNVDYLLPRPQIQSVLHNYLEMVYNTSYTEKNVELIKSPKKYFAGPQPVTLEKKHLLNTEEYPINIFTDYTVTLKADGERYLVFVDKDGYTYLINTRLNIKKIDDIILPNYSMSLFDAEFLKQDKKITLLLFDAYFVKNKIVAQLPLISIDKKPSRYNEIQHFVQYFSHNKNTNTNTNTKTKTETEILAKEFVYPQKNKGITFFDVIKDMFHKMASFSTGFPVDGLIFTPKDLPVKVDVRLQESLPILQNKAPSFGGTWSSVFKWKPPEENTIDFLLIAAPRPHIVKEDGRTYKVFALYCGKSITPFDSTLKFLQNVGQKKDIYYGKKLFVPTFIPFDEKENVSYIHILLSDNNIPLTEQKEYIQDNSIVECSFDLSIKEWKPYRLRNEKTELYHITKNIAGTANDYDVAQSIWKTIVDPVTKKHLLGEEKINWESIYLYQDTYYDEQNIPREKTLTFPMRTFHNKWVKNHMLVSKFSEKVKSLMDPTCGKGGDLFKYAHAKIPVVLGTDLSENNIYNFKDGANQRLSELMQKKEWSSSWKYVFVPMDFSKSIAENIKNKNHEDTELLKILWNKKSTQHPKLQKYQGMASQGFDMLSIQFSLHYFFENKTTLTNCLDNIQQQLKKGGFFVGTCFDGELIDKLFKEKKETVLFGNKENTIWRIRKKYEGRFVPHELTSLGKKIGVFIESINNRENDEYLVGFELLLQELKKRNIRLLNEEESKKILGTYKSHGNFEELYNEMLLYKNDLEENKYKKPFAKQNELIWLNNAILMSPEEKRLSFLYKWFVFTKDK